MALVFISSNTDPSYVALSTDIEDNAIAGATLIGKKVFLSDTGVWKIIEKDLTLSDYVLPVTINVDSIVIENVAVTSIAEGDNNIGNVDVASLPAGNLGQQAMAASVSTVPANNITDATYIGDVKFGESLPAGTNNIGDVDVLTLPSIDQLPAALGAQGALKIEGVASGTAVPVSGTFYQETQPISISQAVDGTTNGVILKAAEGAGAGIGLTSDAAVITDTTGSLSGKIRGLVKWAFERMPAALGQTTKSASLPVTIASDQDDLAIIPHGLADEIIVTPTLTVHATYVSGDYVGTSTTPMEFQNCARVNGGTGLIVGAALIDSNVASVAGELWLFDDTITAPDDSAAWAISGADTVKCIGVIPFSTYYSGGSASASFVNAQSIVFKTESDSRSLYGCFVTRGAPTYADGSLTFKLRVWQD